jgi:hypothetical protein
MSQINKIKARVTPRTTSAPDLSSNHQLKFDRDANEEWNFKDGRIYLNNEDIEDLLDESGDDVKFQSAVSDAVSEYREFAWKNGNGSYEKFAARADAVQNKILNNMKRIYDERTGGVRLKWGDGACLLNNVNVRAIVALYSIRPTEKARIFLNGLKSKLALILMGKNGSSLKAIYDEVEHALDQTPIDGSYLPVNNGSGDSR